MIFNETSQRLRYQRVTQEHRPYFEQFLGHEVAMKYMGGVNDPVKESQE